LIIGVDVGRSFTKAYVPGKKIIFPSFARRAVYREVSDEGDYQITINGDKWFIGDLAKMEHGVQAFSKDKASNEYTMPLLLTAISLLAPRSDIVNVVTGLPISDYRDQATPLIRLLKGGWEIKFRGQEFYISISDVIVFPEGCGAAWSIVLDDFGHAHSKPSDLRVIDIGSKTTDFSAFQHLKYNSVESSSINMGMTMAVNETYKRQAGKTDLLPSEIEPDDKSLQYLASSIQSEIKKWWRRWDSVYLAGGGGEALKAYLQFPLLPDAQFANAIGYYRVGVNRWHNI
jgi:plasmid segregation protein ParM